MIASGSLAMVLKLYVMAPICTPPNFESIVAPKAMLAGTEASAIFPISLLV
jgi:hypothetical protein